MPSELLGSREQQVRNGTRGRRDKMPARPAAHGAVAIDDGPQRSIHNVFDSATQTTAMLE